MNKKRLFSTKELTLMGLFVALCAVCAWISIPLPPPMAAVTLQTFAIFTTIGILGFRDGVISVIVYIILGAVGVPVFSKMTGGPGILLGTTGGYIIGFIISAIAVGLITRKFGKKIYVLAVAMVIGLVLCYAFGTAWFIIVYTKTKGAIGIGTALAWCVTPYIIPDLVKIALAITVIKAVDRTKLIDFNKGL